MGRTIIKNKGEKILENLVELDDRTFKSFKKLKQVMLVLEREDMFNYQIVNLCNIESGELIQAKIISKMRFDNIDDMLKLIPYDWFGEFNKKIDAVNFFESKKLKKIYTYRLKVDNFEVEEIIDKDLINLINVDSIQKDSLGYSVSNVFKVMLKNSDRFAILKIQTLSSRITLEEEYRRLKWLEWRDDIPKVYYWNKIKNRMYLLMEFKEGVPSCDCDNIGFRLGKKLRNFHSININNCEFDNNKVDILLKNCIARIDAVLPQLKKIFPRVNKEEIIQFLKTNAPGDTVLVHGDYSLPNILINRKETNLIDFRDLSISTKYYDLYYVIKSFERNNKKDEIKDFLNAYGIDKLEDKYMKWMEIIDKSIYF